MCVCVCVWMGGGVCVCVCVCGGVGGGGGQYFIKTFPFSMHFNSKNGQFYQNSGVDSSWGCELRKPISIINLRWSVAYFKILGLPPAARKSYLFFFSPLDFLISIF